jgi:hypothetical protein
LIQRHNRSGRKLISLPLHQEGTQQHRCAALLCDSLKVALTSASSWPLSTQSFLENNYKRTPICQPTHRPTHRQRHRHRHRHEHPHAAHTNKLHTHTNIYTHTPAHARGRARTHIQTPASCKNTTHAHGRTAPLAPRSLHLDSIVSNQIRKALRIIPSLRLSPGCTRWLRAHCQSHWHRMLPMLA